MVGQVVVLDLLLMEEVELEVEEVEDLEEVDMTCHLKTIIQYNTILYIDFND